MTDELDDLKAAMRAATPAPDPARKAATLQRAEEIFVRAQESGAEVRPNPKRAVSARVKKGLKIMLNALTSKAGLTASTAIVAVGIILLVPDIRDTAFAPRVAPRPVATVVPAPAPAPSTRADKPALPLADAAPREPLKSSGQVVGQTRQEAAPTVSAEPALPAPAAPPPVAGTRRSFAKSQAAGGVAADALATPQGGIAALQVAPSPMMAAPERKVVRPESNTEAYANAPENPLKVTAQDPVSTFSIDVDTASWSIVRSSLSAGQLPPKDAVRIEEMVNYFPYQYPAPKGDVPFRPTITVMPTPWNSGTELVHIGIQGTLPAIADRPPVNLVFLIDTSGSMRDANKLPLLKQSFRLLLGQLRPQDEVAIVTYAGSAGEVLAPTKASERSKILAALDNLEADGSTAGQAGLRQAYQVAEGMKRDGAVSRVILATDGDFNVGISDPQALKDYIATERDSGTYLSVLGFGRGNLDDATMQALAQNGNGQAAYIDTLNEAQKVLVDQLSGELFPIANDVKIQVEFNPATIAEYRLIGYETRALRRQDFSNDKVDAGDISAGHTVTAIYEVTPVGSPAVRTGPSRYAAQTPAPAGDHPNEIGFFRLRYKTPGEATSKLIEEPITEGMGTVTDDDRFSVAIAGFGELLRHSDEVGSWGWDQAIALANGAKGEDPFGYRAEAVRLMRLARSLSQN